MYLKLHRITELQGLEGTSRDDIESNPPAEQAPHSRLHIQTFRQSLNNSRELMFSSQSNP